MESHGVAAVEGAPPVLRRVSWHLSGPSFKLPGFIKLLHRQSQLRVESHPFSIASTGTCLVDKVNPVLKVNLDKVDFCWHLYLDKVVPGQSQPTATINRPFVCLVVTVTSHESATFRREGGHFCGRVARFATRQRLLQLSSPTTFSTGQKFSRYTACQVASPQKALRGGISGAFLEPLVRFCQLLAEKCPGFLIFF